MFIIDPWSSEANLRIWLERLKEFGELDAYILQYLEDGLHQKILARPSKGSYGEAGKDIVALVDPSNGDYCSYVVKAGNLSKSLDGKYGVLKQMDDAMRIPLEDKFYLGKKRTVVVAHNGVEGHRGAIRRFEDAKDALESEFSSALSRPIERWDVTDIARILYPHASLFRELEEYKNEISRLDSTDDVVVSIKEILASALPKEVQPVSSFWTLRSEIFEVIARVETKYGPFKRRR